MTIQVNLDGATRMRAELSRLLKTHLDDSSHGWPRLSGHTRSLAPSGRTPKLGLNIFVVGDRATELLIEGV